VTASEAKVTALKILMMAKHSLLFATSTIAFPIVGTYRAVNKSGTPLIFKNIDSGALLQISSDGRLLFQRASDVDFYWTYIADLQVLVESSDWHCTFDYFETDMLIQRVGTSMKIGEYTSVENINTDVVSNFDTAIR
jgi:hypothetical protein